MSIKTSNKLLLALFCFISILLVYFNNQLKTKISVKEYLPENEHTNHSINQHHLLKSHSKIIGNSLYIDSSMVILSIDSNASKSDLQHYKEKLKDINISLLIEKEVYDSVGKIKLLSMTVDCNDGYLGWVSKDFTENGKIGFYRNYAKNVELPFEMNPIEFTVTAKAHPRAIGISK